LTIGIPSVLTAIERHLLSQSNFKQWSYFKQYHAFLLEVNSKAQSCGFGSTNTTVATSPISTGVINLVSFCNGGYISQWNFSHYYNFYRSDYFSVMLQWLCISMKLWPLLTYCTRMI
jgi:hypothetical protein